MPTPTMTERQITVVTASLLNPAMTPAQRSGGDAKHKMAYAIAFKRVLKPRRYGPYHDELAYAPDRLENSGSAQWRKNDLTIKELWAASSCTFTKFKRIVSQVSEYSIFDCAMCNGPGWDTSSHAVLTNDGTSKNVCAECIVSMGADQSSHFHCCRHGQWMEAGARFGHATAIRGQNQYLCRPCLDNHAAWCGRCGTWGLDRCRCAGTLPCACAVPEPTFRFRIGPDERSVAQDERTTVHMGGGVINDVGMAEVRRIVTNYGGPWQVLDDVGPLWQAKEGNFPKRVQRAMFKQNQFKASPELVSAIGNAARVHCPDEADYYCEFTRDLNLPMEQFAHDASCWWGGHTPSRCSMKMTGGLALRTYAVEKLRMDRSKPKPIGRAWVLPLTGEFLPGTDPLTAPIFVVFNAYGNIDGYVAARIIASMTGMTYKRVPFTATPMYINNETGYMVAEAKVCAETKDIHITMPKHPVIPQPELPPWEPSTSRRTRRDLAQVLGYGITADQVDRLTEALRELHAVNARMETPTPAEIVTEGVHRGAAVEFLIEMQRAEQAGRFSWTALNNNGAPTITGPYAITGIGPDARELVAAAAGENLDDGDDDDDEYNGEF